MIGEHEEAECSAQRLSASTNGSPSHADRHENRAGSAQRLSASTNGSHLTTGLRAQTQRCSTPFGINEWITADSVTACRTVGYVRHFHVSPPILQCAASKDHSSSSTLQFFSDKHHIQASSFPRTRRKLLPLQRLVVIGAAKSIHHAPVLDHAIRNVDAGSTQSD